MLKRLKPFFSCKEATRLASDAHERPLTRYETIAMRFHMAICLMCRRWERQVGALDSLCRNYPRGIEDTRQYRPDQRLTDACKARIKEALRGESDDDPSQS